MKIFSKLVLFSIGLLLFASCSLATNDEVVDYKELDSSSFLESDLILYDNEVESKITGSRSTNSTWIFTVSAYYSMSSGKDVITWNAHPDASFYLVYGKMGSMWSSPARINAGSTLGCQSDPVFDSYYVRACYSNGNEITGTLITAP